MSETGKDRPSGQDRRTILKGGLLGAVTAPLITPAARGATEPATEATGDDLARIEITVNGRRHRAAIDPRTTLVDYLREHVGLTGTKVGCNHGQCGACTALVNGARVNTCLKLAVQANGAEVVTIEGLADPAGDLHPMQRAFIEHDAFQCGYCTPGQIVSAVACLEEGHAASEAEIREYMSGNLCRCGAYPNIVKAIVAVRDGKV
ncbi:MAG: (2Fe-2S)-binding protein [Paracoccaceae bacterium]